jgi:hypothetical protein
MRPWPSTRARYSFANISSVVNWLAMATSWKALSSQERVFSFRFCTSMRHLLMVFSRIIRFMRAFWATIAVSVCASQSYLSSSLQEDFETFVLVASCLTCPHLVTGCVVFFFTATYRATVLFDIALAVTDVRLFFCGVYCFRAIVNIKSLIIKWLALFSYYAWVDTKFRSVKSWTRVRSTQDDCGRCI